jgi:hypothetical protein
MAAVAVVLMAGAAGYVTLGLRLYDRYQLAYGNWQMDPASSCGALVTWSPPSTIYTAFYINQPTFLAVHFRSPHPEALRLTLSIARFTQEQSVDVQSMPTFHDQSFKPPLTDATVLDSLVGPRFRDSQILLRVQNGTQVCDTSAPVRLESRQVMQWQDAAGNDESKYLAGWVTPQADVISALVGRSAQWLTQNPGWYPDVPALYGYDDGQATHQAIEEQVNAIFDTLQFVYHVHYVDENVPFQQNATQLIQLPKDILSSPAPTAMCVETTALMASAVERIGMRPYIIIVPHHAFLGVALDASASAPMAFWETSDLNGGLRGDQANVHGDSEYNQFQSQSQILRVLDIVKERQQGIEPIE